MRDSAGSWGSNVTDDLVSKLALTADHPVSTGAP